MDDVERANAELERAGAKDTCLACGGPDLIIDPSARTALLALVDRELDPGSAIEAVSLICVRCGFIRMHSTLHLFGDKQ